MLAQIFLNRNGMEIRNQDWPNLKGCRDYSILQKAFTKKELDLYERQIKEYLDMEEITDTYLYHVPRIVCWYEGIIPTAEFIRECKEC